MTANTKPIPRRSFVKTVIRLMNYYILKEGVERFSRETKPRNSECRSKLKPRIAILTEKEPFSQNRLKSSLLVIFI